MKCCVEVEQEDADAIAEAALCPNIANRLREDQGTALVLATYSDVALIGAATWNFTNRSNESRCSEVYLAQLDLDKMAG